MKKLCCVLAVLLIVGTVNANLLLQYEFEDDLTNATGDSTYDGSAMGTDNEGGSISSSLEYGDGKFGKAAYFSGDDFVMAGGDPLDNLTDEITVTFWTKMDESAPDHIAMLAGLDSGDHRMAYIQFWEGTTYWDTNAGRAQAGIPGDAMNGEWQHWAYTLNTNSGDQKIYYNGEVIGSSEGQTTPFAEDSWGSLPIGAHFEWGDTYIGALDDFRIYTNELSQAEIQGVMVPEPATIALLGLGGMALIRKRRNA